MRHKGHALTLAEVWEVAPPLVQILAGRQPGQMAELVIEMCLIVKTETV